MTALAQNTSRDGNVARLSQPYPALTNKIYYSGALIMIDSNGYATPAVAGANNKGVFGFMHGFLDMTGVTSGTKFVQLEEGEGIVPATDTLTQADLGKVVYAGDDNEVHKTQGTNEPRAGRIVKFISATSCMLRVGPDMLG